MAQLSRPYQIALGAVALLGLIWVVALHAHSSNPSGSNPSNTASNTPPPSPAAQAKSAAAPTPIYHGPAPGVEGLTRAIAKAHGAVATSQRNAQQLQRKSNEASSESPTTGSSSSAPVKSSASRGSSAGTKSTSQSNHAATTPAHKNTGQTSSPPRPTPNRHADAVSVQQATVENELAHGKTVMLLFWNPSSSVDQEVRAQAVALANHSKGTVTVHVAPASQVGAFGTITEVAHVYQTPTILIVNKHGVVSTLTGLTDVFALEQSVREARSAAR